MKRKLGIILLTLALALTVSPVGANGSSRVEYTTVNGMQIMLQQTDSELTEVSLLLKSGSGLDPKGKRGTALLMNSLVELKLFSSKEEFGDFNVLTYPDYTVINFKTTATELKLVLQEIKELLTTPLYSYDIITDLIEVYSTDIMAAPVFNKAYTKVGELFYGVNHPYNEVLSPQSIKAIRGTDVYRWYRKTYQPGNAILSIAGGSTMSIKKIEKFFKPMLSEKVDHRLMIEPIFPKKNISADFEDPNGRIATLCMAYPAPRLQDPEYPAFSVLVYYLENFQHYFEELRVKEGLMYSGFVYYNVLEKPKAPGIIFMTMTDRESLPLVEARTVALLSKLRRDGIDQKQIGQIVKTIKAKAKNQVLAGEGIAYRNALGEYLQTRMLETDYFLGMLEKVKTADIKTAVTKYLNYYVRVAFIPGKKAKGLYD